MTWQGEETRNYAPDTQAVPPAADAPAESTGPLDLDLLLLGVVLPPWLAPSSGAFCVRPLPHAME